MRRIWAALTALFLFCGVCAAEEERFFIDRISDRDAAPEFFFAEDAPLLQIIFPNLQEADCALLMSGEDVVMIDCSSTGHAHRVADMLKQLGVEEIDLILNTHPHNDHIMGLDIIAQKVKVHEIAFCFPVEASNHMNSALWSAEKRGIATSWYGDGDIFKVGEGQIEVWLKGDTDWDLNAASAQMRVSFGERSALFTADALERTQQRLLEVISLELLDVDLLKYPHHGIDMVDNSFMEAVSPLYCVITHIASQATKKTQEYLSEKEYPYGFTTGGYLSFTTDGKVWLAEKIPIRDQRKK